MKDLVESMLEWHHEGYMDPGVWEALRPLVNPALMPAPSVLQRLPNPTASEPVIGESF